MNNTILGIYGIEIFSPFDGNDCVITSDMKELDCLENDTFNAAVDGLESLILGHFAAGWMWRRQSIWKALKRLIMR